MKRNFYLVLFFLINAVSAEVPLEILEHQKSLEVEVVSRLRNIDDKIIYLEDKLKGLQQEITSKGIKQLQEKQKDLVKQQVDLNRQGVDLKVLFEKTLKQNQHLEELIFQELRQSANNQAHLKEELSILSKKVEQLKKPFPWLAFCLKHIYYLLGGSLVCLLLVLIKIKRRIPKKEDTPEINADELTLPLQEQLNLAKAYLEIEEKENSRVILERLVTQDEDPDIQKEARKLLNQLDI